MFGRSGRDSASSMHAERSRARLQNNNTAPGSQCIRFQKNTGCRVAIQVACRRSRNAAYQPQGRKAAGTKLTPSSPINPIVHNLRPRKACEGPMLSLTKVGDVVSGHSPWEWEYRHRLYAVHQKYKVRNRVYSRAYMGVPSSVGFPGPLPRNDPVRQGFNEKMRS
jgi:hypothetical protein